MRYCTARRAYSWLPRSMSSRRARPSLIVAGVPTAIAPLGTSVSFSTTAFAATIDSGPHDAAVQDHRGVADQHVVLDRASFEVDQMTQYTVVADHRRGFGRRVQDGVVLNTRPFADPDLSTVAPDHRARPHRRQRADGHGSDDRCLRMDECVAADRWFLVAERVDGHGRTVPISFLPPRTGTLGDYAPQD